MARRILTQLVDSRRGSRCFPVEGQRMKFLVHEKILGYGGAGGKAGSPLDMEEGKSVHGATFNATCEQASQGWR